MFGKKSKSKLNADAFTPISRTKTLNGCFVPAFINNMSYFFTKLQVYEDGLVDAWEMVDLDLFKGKLNCGWVKTSVPDGEDISIHHLGAWEVTQGKWEFNEKSFYDHIVSLVKSLNPEMQNLHDCHGQTTKKVGNMNTSILGLGNGKPYIYEGPEFFQKPIKGDDFSVFVKRDDTSYAIANLCVFANGSVQVSGVPEAITYTFDELKAAVENKNVITEPEKGTTVSIYGLGSFVTGECRHSVEVKQILLDVEETLKKLQGKKTASELCYELFEQFRENPTEGLRVQLQEAYESIPEHLRRYVLGDQDRKDIPVRMAIYGEDEIKKWSHYVVAEQMGEELPSIDVPKPPK